MRTMGARCMPTWYGSGTGAVAAEAARFLGVLRGLSAVVSALCSAFCSRRWRFVAGCSACADGESGRVGTAGAGAAMATNGRQRRGRTSAGRDQ